MLVAVAAIVNQDQQPLALLCQGGARIARQFRWNLMRLDSREEVQTGVVRQAGAVLFNAACCAVLAGTLNTLLDKLGQYTRPSELSHLYAELSPLNSQKLPAIGFDEPIFQSYSSSAGLTERN
jgi:hypothetical protein